MKISHSYVAGDRRRSCDACSSLPLGGTAVRLSAALIARQQAYGNLVLVQRLKRRTCNAYEGIQFESCIDQATRKCEGVSTSSVSLQSSSGHMQWKKVSDEINFCRGSMPHNVEFPATELHTVCRRYVGCLRIIRHSTTKQFTSSTGQLSNPHDTGKSLVDITVIAVKAVTHLVERNVTP